MPSNRVERPTALTMQAGKLYLVRGLLLLAFWCGLSTDAASQEHWLERLSTSCRSFDSVFEQQTWWIDQFGPFVDDTALFLAPEEEPSLIMAQANVLVGELQSDGLLNYSRLEALRLMQLLAQHELHGEQTKIYSFLAERIFSDLGFETADLSIHAAESRTITLCAFECDTPDNHTHSASFLACLEEAK